MAKTLQQDYLSQVVAPEQEAQNENNNLVQIDLSLEAKTYLGYKYKIANRDKLLKKLKRANPNTTRQIFKKSNFICKQAVELAETVLKKIFSGRRVLLNHKYISKITECDSTDQNKRILDQLDNFFVIKYHRLAIVDGIPYNYHYSFELHPAIIEELKAAGLLALEFMPAEMRLSYNNRPYIFSKNIIRSDVHTHESNFSNNSNFSDSLPEQVETAENTVLTTEPVEAKVLVSKKRFNSNTRKKPTVAQRKASRAKVYKLKQYDKPKTLAEIEPITEAESKILQDKSGRNFTLVFQNELLQDLSRKLQRTFESRWQFLNYFAKVLHGEKRDEVKCSGLNFYIKSHKTEEELAKHITQSQRESYIKKEEDAAILNRTDYTQYRAKIAGQFPINLAYALLTSMVGVKKQENVLKLTMHKPVTLSEHYVNLLLKHAIGVGGYAGVSELEFVVMASNSNIRPDLGECSQAEPRSLVTYPQRTSHSTDMSDLTQREALQLLKLPTKGNWGKVCSAFVAEYGAELYTHWLAGLNVIEEDNTIELKTNSGMVRERIEQTYLPFLVKVAGEIGIKTVEFVV